MFYPKIKEIKVVGEYLLEAKFENGIIKQFDFKPRLHSFLYKELADKELFNMAKVEKNGQGVVWSNKVEIAEATLWEEGVAVNCTEQDINKMNSQIQEMIDVFTNKKVQKIKSHDLERIDVILKKLKEAWVKSPGLRFCQLISTIAELSYPEEEFKDKDLYFIEDGKLLEGIDQYLDQ